MHVIASPTLHSHVGIDAGHLGSLSNRGINSPDCYKKLENESCQLGYWERDDEAGGVGCCFGVDSHLDISHPLNFGYDEFVATPECAASATTNCGCFFYPTPHNDTPCELGHYHQNPGSVPYNECMQVCVCVCGYVCLYVYVCVSVCICMRVRMCIVEVGVWLGVREVCTWWVCMSRTVSSPHTCVINITCRVCGHGQYYVGNTSGAAQTSRYPVEQDQSASTAVSIEPITYVSSVDDEEFLVDHVEQLVLRAVAASRPFLAVIAFHGVHIPVCTCILFLATWCGLVM